MLVPALIYFLAQSMAEDIRTKSYKKEYRNFNVNISFDKERVSTVSLLALSKGDNEIGRRIYPALLYYKYYNLITTCFAIESYII